MLMTVGRAVTGVKMVFAHDTEVALVAAAALVNTAGRDGEQLPDLAALDEFFRAYGWTGRREHTDGRAARGAGAAPAAAPDLGGRRGRGRRDRQRAAARVAARCPSSSSTTGGTTTCTRRPPTRRWPPGWRSRPRWRFVDVVRSGELSRLRVCELPRLRQRRRRPVQEPLEALLRRRLRQPRRRHRLPRPQGRPVLSRSSAPVRSGQPGHPEAAWKTRSRARGEPGQHRVLVHRRGRRPRVRRRPRRLPGGVEPPGRPTAGDHGPRRRRAWAPGCSSRSPPSPSSDAPGAGLLPACSGPLDNRDAGVRGRDRAGGRRCEG